MIGRKLPPILVMDDAQHVRGFDGHIRRLYPGRKIAALPWRSDDGFDSIELRMGHLMRRGGQAWPMLMGLSFRGLCECYSAFCAYVKAEQKAGGGGMD